MDFQSLAPVFNYNCLFPKMEPQNRRFRKKGMPTKPQALRLLKNMQLDILTPEWWLKLRFSHAAAALLAHTDFYVVKDFQYFRHFLSPQL